MPALSLNYAYRIANKILRRSRQKIREQRMLANYCRQYQFVFYGQKQPK